MTSVNTDLASDWASFTAVWSEQVSYMRSEIAST